MGLHYTGLTVGLIHPFIAVLNRQRQDDRHDRMATAHELHTHKNDAVPKGSRIVAVAIDGSTHSTYALDCKCVGFSWLVRPGTRFYFFRVRPDDLGGR